MARAIASWGLLLILAACARPMGGSLPQGALDGAIGKAIGDPTTCVLLADRATGKVVYTYGQLFNCQRGLPACDRKGFLSAQGSLSLADTPSPRHASCPSSADGSRSVGWAEGRVVSAHRSLVYSAVMEGDRALPGEEMAARLEGAFQAAGL